MQTRNGQCRETSVTTRYRTDHGGLWPHHSGGNEALQLSVDPVPLQAQELGEPRKTAPLTSDFGLF